MIQFDTHTNLAMHLRQEMHDIPDGKKGKKNILLFAYNGTGKTRLSMAFKELGKQGDERDTLYFNAFTEDLFSWDNDLENDSQRKLKLVGDSQFFSGLKTLEMDTRIRVFLGRYADFDFEIDYEEWSVIFSREVANPDYDEDSDDLEQSRTLTKDHIKVSRGEENMFVWCFFLAVVQLAMDKDLEAYSWVKYIYIDDPISSLDENNAIAVGHHLAQLLTDNDNTLKTVISSHHTLFFNVMWNELNRRKNNLAPYFLSKTNSPEIFTLKGTGDTPFFYHVAMLAELHKASETGNLFTYHFNILRIVLEKTASFHGYKKFSDCIAQGENDPDGMFHARVINLLNHGNYSLYEPREMQQDNKDLFKIIFDNFLNNYKFNTANFPEIVGQPAEA